MLNRISFNGDAAALHSLAAYFDKLDKALAEMHQLLHKEQSPLPIFVKEGSKIIRLPREEIMYIEGYGDYVKIHRSGGKPLLTTACSVVYTALISFRSPKSVISSTSASESGMN